MQRWIFKGRSKIMGFTLIFYADSENPRQEKFVQIVSGGKIIETLNTDFMPEIELFLNGYIKGIREGMKIKENIYRADLTSIIHNIIGKVKTKKIRGVS